MSQPNTSLPIGPQVRIYKALLTQSGTADPTAIVLQNNLGTNILWARSSEGIYIGTVEDTSGPHDFTQDKTAPEIQKYFWNSLITITRISNISVRIITAYISDDETYLAEPQDTLLNKTLVTISIYR